MTVERPPRILSVDVARGITIAFMILVNDPGDWSHVYSQLDHSVWNGWTLTDLVFPNFLFLMGASLIFSLQSRRARGEKRSALAVHVLRRALILFGLDLLIAAFPHFHLGELRLYGVLTRIALCYLCAGLICLGTRKILNLSLIVIVLLVGYWGLMRFVPVPGFGVPTHNMPILDPYRNLTAWLDRGFMGFIQRVLHTGSLYNGTRDPEGLLSTLPAIATTLIGAIAGRVMRLPGQSASKNLKLMLATAVLSIAAGELWGRAFPINKNLWTSSYVLFAAGCSLAGLALASWLVDVRRIQDRSEAGRALLWPWLVLGSNAIVVYAFSDFLVEILDWIRLRDDGKSVTAGGWIYVHLFSHHHSTELTSVAYAIVFVAVCFIPNWVLWRKRIFVKI